MKEKSFQILLSKDEKSNDNQASEYLDKQTKNLGLPIASQRKIFRIGMELYQNLVSHRHPNHLGLLRITVDSTDKVRIVSINFCRKEKLDLAEKKFLSLKDSKDARINFMRKLVEKTDSNGKNQGDFGLDFCFRYSKEKYFQKFTRSNSPDIIYLAFSFPIHE
jgi:hypothetical protein